MPDRPTLPYEEAAGVVTVTGWACKSCKRWFADEEDLARYCCAESMPCDCGRQRREKHYTCCELCRAERAAERYAKLSRVEWDGETPLCEWMSDRYFWDIDEVQDAIDEDPDIRLEVCVPQLSPIFEMSEFLADVLPLEDGELRADATEIDAAVNAWIAKHSPFSWTGSGKVPSRESLAKVVDLRDDEEDGDA